MVISVMQTADTGISTQKRRSQPDSVAQLSKCKSGLVVLATAVS